MMKNVCVIVLILLSATPAFLFHVDETLDAPTLVAREGFEIVTGNRQHSSRVVRSAQKATASHDHSKQAHHEATSSNSHPKAVTHKPKSHQSQHKKESAEIKDVKTKPKMNRPVKPGKRYQPGIPRHHQEKNKSATSNSKKKHSEKKESIKPKNHH